MKKVILFTMIGLFFLAYAQNSTAADWRFSEAREVDYVWPQDGGFMFGLKGATIDVNSMPTNATCPNRFVINTGAYEKEKIQAVLAAFMLGGTVILKYDHASTLCNTPVIHVKALSVP